MSDFIIVRKPGYTEGKDLYRSANATWTEGYDNALRYSTLEEAQAEANKWYFGPFAQVNVHKVLNTKQHARLLARSSKKK